MKKMKDQIDKMMERLTDKIDDRDITFDERSEKWQDSEKGEDFDSKTDQLRETFENLEMTLESLNEFLGE